MAADVKQAFTAADMQPSEKVAVRMAYGMRQYNELGEEIYGILKKNLYGSPLASRNWAKCRNDYLLKEMGKKENWKVQQMLYEPCMFIVTIDGRKTYMSCHTDDLDCACEDVRDCQAIFNKLNDEFGIEICNEKYMLGVNRDRWIENGISQNRLSQVAYIEEAWEDYGKYRKGKRAPMKPSDDMSWLEAVHGVVRSDGRVNGRQWNDRFNWRRFHFITDHDKIGRGDCKTGPPLPCVCASSPPQPASLVVLAQLSRARAALAFCGCSPRCSARSDLHGMLPGPFMVCRILCLVEHIIHEHAAGERLA